jgi:hypothetical protein
MLAWMNLRRKMRITSVRERTLIVRNRDSLDTRWCRQCARGSVMVSASVAADISQQSLRAICRHVEAEEVHYFEGPEGLFICLSSLPDE